MEPLTWITIISLGLKHGPAWVEAVAAAIANKNPVVADEIRATFKLIHDCPTLESYEVKAGVVVNPDGSVSPQLAPA